MTCQADWRTESSKNLERLRASSENYLETMLLLTKAHYVVRSVDLAQRMEVSKASVSHAVRQLRERGLVTMDSAKFLHLTDSGRRIAESIHVRHCFLRDLLVSMGVDPETAEQDAGQIKHMISEESYRKLREIYGGGKMDEEYV